MKSVNYDCLTLKVPDKVLYIAKDLNGMLYGYYSEPKWIKGEWEAVDKFRWHIGSYEVTVASKESLVFVGDVK